MPGMYQVYTTMSYSCHMTGVYHIYTWYIGKGYVSLSFVAGFRGLHQARPDPTPQDMPDDHRQYPDDAADFELPDQQELIDPFMAGLCKESQHDCSSLVQKAASCLIATLYSRSETKTQSGKGLLQNARSCCIGMDSRTIGARKVIDILVI